MWARPPEIAQLYIWVHKMPGLRNVRAMFFCLLIDCMQTTSIFYSHVSTLIDSIIGSRCSNLSISWVTLRLPRTKTAPDASSICKFVLPLRNLMITMLSRSLLTSFLLLDTFTVAGPFLIFDLDNETVTSSNPFTTTSPSTKDNETTPPQWLSPEYKWFFEFPLPIPQVKQPKL